MVVPIDSNKRGLNTFVFNTNKTFWKYEGVQRRMAEGVHRSRHKKQRTGVTCV